MSLCTQEEAARLLVCPRCRGALVQRNDRLACGTSACELSRGDPFLRVSNQHVLIDYERSILERARFSDRAGDSEIARGAERRAGGLRGWLRGVLEPRNEAAARCAGRMAHELPHDGTRPRLLVIGGGRISSGPESLYDDPRIEIIAFDIYVSPLTQFVADAHQIPLPDACVDGVWIQAVLEHVLDPTAVVGEIARVIRPGGIVFADTPFLQAVHEGPYDFTRFTESGHRWLFRDFERIDSGTSAGTMTQFLWAVESVARGIFRSARVGVLVRHSLFWLRPLDLLIPAEHHVDAASGVYFYGRRSTHHLAAPDMLSHYRGAQWPRSTGR